MKALREWFQRSIIIPMWLFVAMIVVIVANAINWGLEFLNG